MKFIKGFFTFIFGLVLLILILTLSLVLRTKKFIEKDLVVSAVKDVVASSIEGNELTIEQKQLLNNLVDDKEAVKVVKRIVQNYLSYKAEDVYYLTIDDYDLLINFLSNHINDVNLLSETKYTVDDIKQELKYEDVKKGAEEAFKNFEKEIDSEGIDEVMSVYAKTTSKSTIWIFIVAIIVCILIIALINWSFIKWMKVLGIDLMISGILISTLFILGVIAKNLIKGDENLIEFVQNINLSGFIILGAVEIIIGIVFIMLFKYTKKNANQGAL